MSLCWASSRMPYSSVVAGPKRLIEKNRRAYLKESRKFCTEFVRYDLCIRYNMPRTIGARKVTRMRAILTYGVSVRMIRETLFQNSYQ